MHTPVRVVAVRRTLAVVVLALAATACAGAAETATDAASTPPPAAATGSPSASAAPAEATEPAAAAARPTDVPASGASEPADEAVAFDDPEQEAAAEAWSEVFDTSVPVERKAEHLPDAAALQPTLQAYAAAGEGVGGISLRPTDVAVDGDTAEITYDVLFGGNVAYSGQTGSVDRVDDTWVVGRDAFCAFTASARAPCE
jgi:hypothetical protein